MLRITQLVNGIGGNGLCSFHILFQELELYPQAKEPYAFSASTLPLRIMGTSLDREQVGHFLKYFRNPVSSQYGDQISIHSAHGECLLFTSHCSWVLGLQWWINIVSDLVHSSALLSMFSFTIWGTSALCVLPFYPWLEGKPGCSHGLTFLWAAVENGVWTHGSCQKWKLSFLCLKCHSAPSSANSRADKIGKANCRISRQHWASPPFAPTYPLSISLCLTREQGPVLSGHRHFPRAGPLPGFGRTRGLGWKVFPWRWNSNWNLMSSFSTL